MEDKINQLFKTALSEVILKPKQIFADFLAENVEDIALEKAIKEGKDTKPISREAIFKILGSKR